MRDRYRDRLREGNIRIAAVLMLVIAVIATSFITASAAPLVIKGGKDDAGSGQANNTETVQRDRSLQDGTLIYGLTPVYPEDIQDGTYEAEAVSSSQYFRITDVALTTEGTYMTAVIRISSTSYSYVYPGTSAEAAAADKSEWIPADESSGYGEFGIEVEALNKEIPCAAYSKKKQKWYDRDIVILAESLPEGAVLTELAEGGGTIADTQEAAMKVIYIAIGIIIVGGVLNHFIKRRYYE